MTRKAKNEEVFINLRKPFRLGCCDCGLVHNIRFTVYQHGKPARSRLGATVRLSIKAERNQEATKQLRKERKFVKQ